MKKWLVVALGLLALAVPSVSGARTVGLTWYNVCGSYGACTPQNTVSLANAGTDYLTSAVDMREVNPFPSLMPGQTIDGTPSLKVIVTGTFSNSAGGLISLIPEVSVDGKTWEQSNYSAFTLSQNQQWNANANSAAGVCVFSFKSASTKPRVTPYVRFRTNNTATTATVAGARILVAYDDDRDHEMVVRKGQWTVNANSNKDTCTVVGFTGRDTTTWFDIDGLTTVNKVFGAVADSSSASVFLALSGDTLDYGGLVADSIYVQTDVSYNGGTSFTGGGQFRAQAVSTCANQYGTTITSFSTAGSAPAQIILVPIRAGMDGVSNTQDATTLFGATHVRFRIAATAGQKLFRAKPYLVYWRHKV